MWILSLLAFTLAGLEPYHGQYLLVAPESDNLPEIIERTVRQFNFLIRPIARSRLQRTNVAFPAISFERPGDSGFRIAHVNGTAVLHRVAGEEVSGQSPDGSGIRVRLNAGPPLREVYQSDEGRRENTYELVDGGRRLLLHVVITSPRLREPIKYRLVYKRAPDTVVR